MGPSRSDVARREALAATADLIAERGVDNLTIEDVAARSGVAKTTIYRHWPSRGPLIIDAVRSCWAHLPTPDTGDLRTDLVRLFEGMVRVDLSSLAGRIMPSLLSVAGRDPEVERLTRELAEERARPVREILGRAVARGELSTAVDEEVALGLVVGPLLYRKLHRRLPLTTEYLEACIDAAVVGLQAMAPVPSGSR
ncbi:MAG TPA: TetR/AcrR family transcriptional regulator [Acidimicrobiales bacterium]|jgi:AcrR family transcriptional regulator|nr:TetR/AcrR family transcriptional regulator [Acidimicrobiales bacterium]